MTTKIKTFVGQSPAVDTDVNTWLAANEKTNVDIMDIKIAAAISISTYEPNVVVAVFYREKPPKE